MSRAVRSLRRVAVAGGTGRRKLAVRAFWCAVVTALIVITLAVNSPFMVFLTITTVVYAVAATAQDWLLGRTGQVSVGGAAMMAVGAYTTATLSHFGVHDYFIAVAASAAAAAVLGFAVAVSAVRLRGVYVLLATLALEYVVSFAAQTYQSHVDIGGLAVDPASIFSSSISSGRSALIVYALTLGLMMALLAGMVWRGPGRVWESVRESQLAAGVIGVRVFRAKLFVFVGSSAMTGVAGSMYAFYSGIVSYESFSLDLAILLVVMAYVGGTRSFLGPIVGAAFVTFTPWALQQISASVSIGSWMTNNEATLANCAYGIAFLAVLLYERGGLIVAVPRIGRGVWRLAVAVPRLAQRPNVEPEPARNHLSIPVGISDVTAEKPEILSGPPALEVTDLSVTYPGGARAVDGLCFVLGQGEAVGLVGANGAGKTSTLRAIAGFDSEDRVSVKGSIRTQRKSRHQVVLIPERDKLIPSLTVDEHIRLIVTDKDRASELRRTFPIIERKGATKAGLLSGGERQILAIALGWARDPEILMIDEVTLGLAPIAITSVVEQLKVLQQTGLSLILSDQDMSAALQLCQRVLRLDHGVAVSLGSSVPALADVSADEGGISNES